MTTSHTQHPVTFDPCLATGDPEVAARACAGAIRALARSIRAEDRSTFLMRLDQELYSLHGEAAIATNNGLHPKHDLIRYREFFLHYIRPGARVLDLGCGVGVVALALAEAGAIVTGVDRSEASLAKATIRASELGVRERTTFVKGDITTHRVEETFDVVILSNVLEHLEHRSDLLRLWSSWYSPQAFLIRVPAYDRDWRVPWKEHLGIDWRLDDTHCTEYAAGQLEREVTAAGLVPHHMQCQWGEYYCCALRPRAESP